MQQRSANRPRARHQARAAARTLTTAVLAAAALALAGCTGGSSGGGPTGSPAVSSGTAGPSTGSPTGSAAALPEPVFRRVVNYYRSTYTKRSAELLVYPLQRVDGRVLLTVDLVPQQGSDARGTDALCRAEACSDLSGVNLVDTVGLVRWLPLEVPGEQDETFTSRLRSDEQTPGTTYRMAAFFPDPGVSSVAVTLEYGGVALDVPVTDGTPFPGLVLPAGERRPEEAVEATTSSGGPLQMWPVVTPGPDAVVVKHDLAAPVVGGTVNQGRGVVSLNADILFAFNSAKLSARATALLAQAATLITANADPAKPVNVVGHTDDLGTEAFNRTLSEQRAAAVAAALKGKVGGIALRTSGRGETEPVAPNRTGDQDNPAGRALNRRVEITYSPKPAPAPSSAPTTGTGGSGAETGGAPSRSADLSAAGTAGPTPGVKGEKAVLKADVFPVLRTGNLALVQVDVTSVGQDTDFYDFFSSQGRASRDVGALHLTDPATKKVYVPARDVDAPTRLTQVGVKSGMDADVPFRFWFFAAAPPAEVGSVDVQVGPIGVVRGVPVQ